MDIRILADRESVYEVYLDGEKAERYCGDNTREVFFTKKYVVKLDCSNGERATNQSQRENSIWKKVKKSHRSLFVPILEYKSFGKWKAVVQPKIDFTEGCGDEVENHKDYDVVTNILVSEYGVCDTWDGWNIGITRENKLVCYDYGI